MKFRDQVIEVTLVQLFVLKMQMEQAKEFLQELKTYRKLRDYYVIIDTSGAFL